MPIDIGSLMPISVEGSDSKAFDLRFFSFGQEWIFHKQGTDSVVSGTQMMQGDLKGWIMAAKVDAAFVSYNFV